MDTFIFVVSPSGEWYSTSRVSDPCRGDPHHAYFTAHLRAAVYAAQERQPAFVTRRDTGNARYGFAACDLENRKSVLRRVMAHHVHSYFSFETCAWRPLILTEPPNEVRRITDQRNKRDH